VRLTRAAKKKATAKRNEPEMDASTQRKSAPKVRPLTLRQKIKLNKIATEPTTAQGTLTRSAARKSDQTNNNALSIGKVLVPHTSLSTTIDSE